MKKAEIITELNSLKVDLTPAQDGTLKAETLQLILDGAEKLPAIENELKATTAALEESQTALEESLADVEALNEKLAEIEANPKSAEKKKPVFKVGKKSYQLVIPESRIMLAGKVNVVSEETLRANNDLLTHCVKIGAGCLVEITNS